MAKKPPQKRIRGAHLDDFMWKPGQSGNPAGRPPNPIPRALKELTVESYRKVIEAVCTGNLDNLRMMIDDPGTSALQVGIATSVLNAVVAGDYSVIERIAERIIGKIPEELKVSSINANVNAVVDREKLRAIIDVLQNDI